MDNAIDNPFYNSSKHPLDKWQAFWEVLVRSEIPLAREEAEEKAEEERTAREEAEYKAEQEGGLQTELN